ncbi:hypothetical protein [Streptomyces lunaelactis]|uniref:hypothetical protein n=1 Tax=Streptomyces lunaelactis TaxID=1535768 RepID=UPI0020C7E640|nr:hypothetical protein [Streptomyces lunaelactis]
MPASEPIGRCMAQLAMVMNLDKCIGCHTCSVTCKQAWTNRSGVVHHLADTPPRDLAETYVATFDRRRRCCLYLTLVDRRRDPPPRPGPGHPQGPLPPPRPRTRRHRAARLPAGRARVHGDR